MQIHAEKKCVKHILNAHDGEARLVGDYEWPDAYPRHDATPQTFGLDFMQEQLESVKVTVVQGPMATMMEHYIQDH